MQNSNTPLLQYSTLSAPRSLPRAFINRGFSLAFSLCSVGILLTMLSFGATPVKQNLTAEKPTAVKAQAAYSADAPTSPAQGPQCSAPYVEIAGPGSGTTDPTMGELTIEMVSIGEPFTTCSDQSITFVMRVATMDPGRTGMATPPPNAEWLISFQITDDSAGLPETVFVSMDTKAPGGTPANPEFSWGTGGSAVCTAGTTSSCPTISGSVTAAGLITIKLTDTTLSFPTFTWTPKKGTVLTSISGATSLVQTIQTDGNGSYTMQGNLACSASPVAALSANPTSGTAPLTVNFDASGSNIPAGGCGTINSYIFDFGDGTGVTQATPTVSHTYGIPGNYAATVSVKNTAGLTSTNIAQQNITVSWLLAASPDASAVLNTLSGVTCASASDCFAVGYYAGSSGNQTLIEQWDGTAWSIATSPNNGTSTNQLSSVTCASASDCFAVGYYTGSSGFQTLIEQWDGTAWSVVSSPNNGTSTNILTGVTCASASECFAAGYYYNGSNQTLIEQWDGTGWSIVTSPDNGTHTNVLNGVTCASASECFAVGFYFNDSFILQTLVEQWDGTAWSIVTSPNNGMSHNILTGVTCASASECFAVGYYAGSSGNQTLIERWDGTAWSIVASPNNGTLTNQLYSVTCPSASECWAVGYSYNSSNIPQTLVERWDGTAWSIVASPNNGISTNQLSGVTCASPSECWAVGYYIDGSTDQQTLIEGFSVPAVQLVSVVSELTHGSAGPFDINLPLTGNPGIECRSSSALGNGNYQMIFTFSNPLTRVDSASVANGTGSVSSSAIGPNPNQYTVNLTGVTNAQYITVGLTNVTDSAANSSSSVLGPSMGVLIADVNASLRVDAADVSSVRQQTLQDVTISNFRNDINASGRIDAADVSIARQQTLTVLP